MKQFVGITSIGIFLVLCIAAWVALFYAKKDMVKNNAVTPAIQSSPAVQFPVLHGKG